MTKIDNSYRRTLLYMVEQDYQYFPTLNEIRDGLLEGQRNKYFELEWNKSIDTMFLYKSYLSFWNQIARSDLQNPNKPLRAAILSDLTHPITNHLIKVYTKECFVYKELNKTTRNKIEENIEYFGPFAAAFG